MATSGDYHDDEFEQPTGGGGYFKPADHDGHLILVTEVLEKGREYNELAEKEVDVVVALIADIDAGDTEPEQYRVNRPGITNKLKVGKRNVLGRIGTLDTGKPKPAWILQEYAEADANKAKAWLTEYRKREFAQPGDEAPAKAPAAKASETKAAKRQAATVIEGDASDEGVAAALDALNSAPPF